MFVWHTPLPGSHLCSNITVHPMSNCNPHPWYFLPCSISVLSSQHLTWDFIHLSINLSMCVHVCICMYMHVHVCVVSLCPHCNVLISCYSDAWNIAGTQIHVIFPVLNSHRLPGLSSGNSPYILAVWQGY